jgi:hypothetical protein
MGEEMSREFGEYVGGYFHNKIQSAYEDCKGSGNKLTQMWGEFLEEFYDVAYEIANFEASDSGLYAPIMESIKQVPVMQKKLAEIEEYLYDYKRVAEEAVREKCAKEGLK